LRIRELLRGDHDVTTDLETALQATQLALTRPVATGQGFSLYSGAGGLADLLLEAAQTLGRPELHQAAEAVGRTGISRFHETDMPWPCGVPVRGETPNLMLGLAGIGYLYLRLYAPESVRSILVLTPETLAHDEDRATRAVKVAS
jgi:hypothetical protein